MVLFSVAGAFAQDSNDEPNVVSTAQEIAADLDSVPCDNSRRGPAVLTLFRKMLADDAHIRVQEVDGAVNVMVTRPGNSQEKIVVGAHYDFVDIGCGAIDNWSGVVALAHMYRTVSSFPTDKTIIFVAFGNEETGLLGSRGMVSDIAQEELPQYCAMINLDSFGLAMPTALTNLSNESMLGLAHESAKVLKMPFEQMSVPAANSDSTSFMSRSIPAITLSGIGAGWGSILHTDKDQVATLNPASVYLGYRLALSMLVRLDEVPCRTYP